MKIKLPEIDFKRTLKYSEGTDTKKVYCCNCKNLRIIHCVSFCIDLSNHTLYIPRAQNKMYNCKIYIKKWYKFWVR